MPGSPARALARLDLTASRALPPESPGLPGSITPDDFVIGRRLAEPSSRDG